MNSTIAVDLAKNVFQIVVSRHPGKVAETYRLSRSKLLDFFAQRQPAVVVLEACGSAHYWGRQLRALGHTVRLLPPHAVKPYCLRNKTDLSDAQALLEAHRNQRIHCVPVKDEHQQGIANLHGYRCRWMADRIACFNQLRSTLREYGVAVPVGVRHVLPYLYDHLDEIPQMLHRVLDQASQQIATLELCIRELERQLRDEVKANPIAQRLLSIPGIGLLTATALVGHVGEVQRFPSSRRFASSLGLTPREHSSGHRRRLGRIDKRGDSYLRTLLVSGGRAVLISAQRTKSRPLDRLRQWALCLQAAKGPNRAAVAVANKLARIVWAVWRNDGRYESQEVVLPA